MAIDIIREWLVYGLKTAKARDSKITQTALAQHLGMTNSEMSRFISGKRKQLTLEETLKAAEFLNIGLPEALFDFTKLYVKKIPLYGELAAGLLQATPMSAPSFIGTIPYLPVDIFEGLEQYAYQLKDSHAEDYAPKNSFVIFVDFQKVRERPQHGDIVRIEEKITTSGRVTTREMIESTLRRAEVGHRGIMLRKLSSEDPNVQDIPYDPSDEAVVIRDLAIGYVVITAGRIR